MPHFLPRQSVLLACLIPVLFTACDKSQEAKHVPPPPVSVVTIKPTNVPMIYEAVGQTAGYREIEVRARVEGILLKRTYTEGKPVKEGQLLFQIDPAPYRAALDQARGVQAQAKAQLEKARLDKDRIIPLYQENAVSKKDYDDAFAAFDTATANLDSATARLQEAQINLDYTNVVAPIGGMASKINVSEGSLVAPTANGGLLTTIAQLDPLYANFSFSEADQLNMQRGQQDGRLIAPANRNFEVELQLADGSSYSRRGHVDFADSKVDPTTGTIRARAIVPNPDGQLLPGQFVRVRLHGVTIKDAILVPQRSVLQQQADKIVLVVNAKNVVEVRPVELGATHGNDYVVTKGLKGGERVITDGVLKAKPGAPVTIAPPAAHASAPAAR
ncbi:MexE family multidrug efflux RND transporter periplasmic adaptor subunit [Chitiniphilus shinanonensis]|uniref:MexE family multidrug efflux RND transporter periplasmic adaptor subunit n=1 Tax=Chitiniphilus shinanonensis TaxID=553088 RepID=A0ABQ6BVD5_9NEIS|nr:efflux RND transporter periplasmic adaptor subunit [Chitiniphilus shinanonensis]GLS05449.1 MexE family multidrug efflux RND transporter periplasmic adaptor subunit [Chitiniphilus shinanonensis]